MDLRSVRETWTQIMIAHDTGSGHRAGMWHIEDEPKDGADLEKVIDRLVHQAVCTVMDLDSNMVTIRDNTLYCQCGNRLDFVSFALPRKFWRKPDFKVIVRFSCVDSPPDEVIDVKLEFRADWNSGRKLPVVVHGEPHPPPAPPESD